MTNASAIRHRSGSVDAIRGFMRRRWLGVLGVSAVSGVALVGVQSARVVSEVSRLGSVAVPEPDRMDRVELPCQQALQPTGVTVVGYHASNGRLTRVGGDRVRGDVTGEKDWAVGEGDFVTKDGRLYMWPSAARGSIRPLETPTPMTNSPAPRVIDSGDASSDTTAFRVTFRGDDVVSVTLGEPSYRQTFAAVGDVSGYREVPLIHGSDGTVLATLPTEYSGIPAYDVPPNGTCRWISKNALGKAFVDGHWKVGVAQEAVARATYLPGGVAVYRTSDGVFRFAADGVSLSTISQRPATTMLPGDGTGVVTGDMSIRESLPVGPGGVRALSRLESGGLVSNSF